MVWDTMFAKVPAPLESIHPVPIDATPEESAQSYQKVLQKAYGADALDPKRPFFDVSDAARTWSRRPHGLTAAG